MKRIVIATLLGLVFGFVCFGFACSSGKLALPVTLQIIASRTLIGFAIGISSLKPGHWTIHGIVMGLLFSLPLAFSGLMAPENPDFSQSMMFISTVIMGIIYGFLIELFTSVVFKAKQK
jgi:membrane protein DedA with SNARE-associated domain